MRIVAEYLEPQKRLREAGIEGTIVFFGSARTLARDDAERSLTEIRDTADAAPEDIARAEHGIHMARYYEAARALSHKLTEWATELHEAKGAPGQRFSVVTGGGPGFMEAANHDAAEAGGSTIGMNISLPFELYPNEYISDGLAFKFHYFFMRNFWLVYLAKAVVAMPGGFGTLDEFTELLTLIQTKKIRRKMPILLFGKEYWEKIIEFEPVAEFGTINRDDLALFHISDSVEESFDWLKYQLSEWAVDHPGAGLTPELEIIGLLARKSDAGGSTAHGEQREILLRHQTRETPRHPEVFGASFDAEVSEPLVFFAGRLKTGTVFGAFDDQALQRVAGPFASTSANERHNTTLFGMYVRVTARGQGMGQSLVESVIEAAAAHYV